MHASNEPEVVGLLLPFHAIECLLRQRDILSLRRARVSMTLDRFRALSPGMSWTGLTRLSSAPPCASTAQTSPDIQGAVCGPNQQSVVAKIPTPGRMA